MENFDMSGIRGVWDIVTEFVNGALAALPSLVLAMVTLFIFYLGAKLARRLARKVTAGAIDDTSLQSLFGTFAYVAVLVTGLIVSAAVVFPGLGAGDILAVVGLSSVAIGFAFKDIVENFFAGILILARRPFLTGDQIETDGLEGTVEEITLRSTLIKTYDGQRVVVPNAQVFKSAVTVRTAFDKRRTTFSTGVGYDEDIDHAREVIRKALEDCDGIVAEPAPQIYCVEHGGSSVNFDIRYWTAPEQATVARVKDEVATRVKNALDDADIEIPYPYRTVEFFDMTAQNANAAAAE